MDQSEGLPSGLLIEPPPWAVLRDQGVRKKSFEVNERARVAGILFDQQGVNWEECGD
jgi:hypothetical protein